MDEADNTAEEVRSGRRKFAGLFLGAGAFAATALAPRGVNAQAIGPAPVSLAGNSINLLDQFNGVGLGNATADTAALTSAIATAATKAGTTIYLPKGSYKFTSPGSGGFALPSYTTLCGDGAGTAITWNDGANNMLFTAAGTSGTRTTDITVADIKITGSALTKGKLLPQGLPLYIKYTDGVTITGVISEYACNSPIATEYCTDVRVLNCTARYGMGDSIGCHYCAGVQVVGNRIEHGDDDGISVHSAVGDPWTVRKNTVISGNYLFDAQGIKVLSARNCSITGNTIDFCKTQGIMVQTFAPGDPTLLEGQSAAQAIVITGNSITNLFSRTPVDGVSNSAVGIYISGTSARAGTMGGIPGTSDTTSGQTNAGVLNPYPYFIANSYLTTVATPESAGVVVAGNFIGRTLPPCDGTVINPTTGTAYAKVSDWGFSPGVWSRGASSTGYMWNGALTLADMQDYAVQIDGGVVRDVLIASNVIRGMLGGLLLGNAVRLDNIVFKDNVVSDFTDYGVNCLSTGTTRAYVDDNLFDGDPYYLSTYRSANGAANGSWAGFGGLTVIPIGIAVTAGNGGLVVRRNTFRNLIRIAPIDSSAPSGSGSGNIAFADNCGEAWATASGYNALNRGIGYIDVEGGVRWSQMDFAPADASFGGVAGGSSVQMSATAEPTSGRWVQGRFLRNTGAAIVSGKVLLGWLRLTTGSANVDGTDWTAIYGSTS